MANPRGDGEWSPNQLCRLSHIPHLYQFANTPRPSLSPLDFKFRDYMKLNTVFGQRPLKKIQVPLTSVSDRHILSHY
jgi:hypothetical protein